MARLAVGVRVRHNLDAMTAELSEPLAGKVLVTGASGFIGGRLRKALLAAGADVISLVRPTSPASQEGRVARIAYDDQAQLLELMAREKPDYVFHVAGATKGVTYQDFHEGNVVPTAGLLAAVHKAHPGLRRFVHVSSGSAYGPSNAGPPKRESDSRSPIEHYGRSKLEAERAVEAMGDAIAWTIVRPATVFGPGEADLLTLFKAAEKGVNLFYGNRQKRCSCVYVDDLVDAMVIAAQREQTRGRGYFICDDEPYTWEQIQSEVGRAVGRRALDVDLPSFLVSLAGAAGELVSALDGKPRLFNRQRVLMDAQQAWLFSNETAKRDFGFRCRFTMREGMAHTVRWYREHGWL